MECYSVSIGTQFGYKKMQDDMFRGGFRYEDLRSKPLLLERDNTCERKNIKSNTGP